MKVGILGAGNIARKMAQVLRALDGVEGYAVASRDYAKAKAFATEHGVSRPYGSYAEMLADPAIDLVYIATPHSHHYEHIKLCLEAGKNVLCEKAFTLNVAQAKEVLALGEQKKLLVAEAIWTRYLPMRWVLDGVLASGAIGTPYSLSANLCYPLMLHERNIKPELGGGALLDLGVYTVNFALMTFGSDIASIDAVVQKYKTGVDTMSSVTLTYADGKMALLHSSMLVRSDCYGMVYGDKGYIAFSNINNCEGIRVYDIEGKLAESYSPPPQINGFEYQVLACKKALETGISECPEMPHTEIIRVMEILDRIRAIGGVKYAGE
jgi:predicted dehydrogenase